MRKYKNLFLLLLFLNSPSSISAGNLTPQETIDYINDKVGSCIDYDLKENSTRLLEYKNITFNLHGTVLSVDSREIMNFQYGAMSHKMDVSITRSIDVRDLDIIRVEEVELDTKGCRGSIELSCYSPRCTKYYSKSHTDGSIDKGKGKGILLRFDLTEQKDLERLRKAFNHLVTTVKTNSPTKSNIDPFD